LSMVKDNVIVHWDYDLPSGVTSQDLVICTSWSGNTQETISSYDQAIAGGLDTVVITRGGALANKAKQNNTSLVILPDKNIPPRGAVGYMAGAMFSVLGQENSDIAIDEKALDKTGKDLAEKLGDKIPLIYASY
jgi:glucose/mannose-6-phosphate isomerase